MATKIKVPLRNAQEIIKRHQQLLQPFRKRNDSELINSKNAQVREMYLKNKAVVQLPVAEWPGLGRFLWGLGELTLGGIMKITKIPGGDALISQGMADISGGIVDNMNENSEKQRKAEEENRRNQQSEEENGKSQ